MVRHTSTVVSVPSQAETQVSPIGVAWSTNALVACSLRMGSQDSSPSHGPIVLRCPGNGREAPMPNCSRTDSGLRREATSARDPLSYIFISRFLDQRIHLSSQLATRNSQTKFAQRGVCFVLIEFFSAAPFITRARIHLWKRTRNSQFRLFSPEKNSKS